MVAAAADVPAVAACKVLRLPAWSAHAGCQPASGAGSASGCCRLACRSNLLCRCAVVVQQCIPSWPCVACYISFCREAYEKGNAYAQVAISTQASCFLLQALRCATRAAAEGAVRCCHSAGCVSKTTSQTHLQGLHLTQCWHFHAGRVQDGRGGQGGGRQRCAGAGPGARCALLLRLPHGCSNVDRCLCKQACCAG